MTNIALLPRLTRLAPEAKSWDGFELAVRAVLGQQITVTAAVGLAGKLVARYGQPLSGTGLETEGFTMPFLVRSSWRRLT